MSDLKTFLKAEWLLVVMLVASIVFLAGFSAMVKVEAAERAAFNKRNYSTYVCIDGLLWRQQTRDGVPSTAVTPVDAGAFTYTQQTCKTLPKASGPEQTP